MNVINRMTLRELSANFRLALALMTGTLLFEKIYRLIKMIPGLPLAAIGKFFVLLLPSFLPLGIPMALLIAVLLSYGRMTMDGELIALRAGGASPWTLVRPALRFSLFCAVFALASSVLIAPLSRRAFRDGVAAIVPETIRVDEGVITEAFPGTVLFVGEKVSERSFRKIFLFRESDGALPAVAIAAESGTLVLDAETNDMRFVLENGQVHRADSRTDVLLRFGSYDLALELPVVKAGRRREEMGIGDLVAAGRDETLSERERLKMRMELHRRFTWPAACLILGFIGAPLGAWSGKSGRLGGFVAALIVLAFFYYLVISTEGFVLKGVLSAAAGLWLPNAVGAAGGGLLFRMRGGIR